MIHSLVRIVVRCRDALAAGARAVREFWFGGQRTECFVGSTLPDPDFPPTRVTLPFPRRKDRP